MKHLIIKLALASSFLLPIPAVASGTRRISTSDAQGTNGKTLHLLIHPGYGLTMDFLEVDEIIVEASLADPSNFTFSGLVGNLCPKNPQAQCDGNGARGIRIGRLAEPIKFPHISSSPDGTTILTLVTQGMDGLKFYKFILKKGQGKPSFDHISVTPDPEKLPLNVSQEELDKARERWQGNKSNCHPRKFRVASTKVVEEDTKQCDSI